MRDKNDRKYTLRVNEVDVGVMTGERGPGAGVVIEFDGSLSRKAKTEIKNALTLANFEIRENKKVLA